MQSLRGHSPPAHLTPALSSLSSDGSDATARYSSSSITSTLARSNSDSSCNVSSVDDAAQFSPTLKPAVTPAATPSTGKPHSMPSSRQPLPQHHQAIPPKSSELRSLFFSNSDDVEEDAVADNDDSQDDSQDENDTITTRHMSSKAMAMAMAYEAAFQRMKLSTDPSLVSYTDSDSLTYGCSDTDSNASSPQILHKASSASLYVSRPTAPFQASPLPSPTRPNAPAFSFPSPRPNASSTLTLAQQKPMASSTSLASEYSSSSTTILQKKPSQATINKSKTRTLKKAASIRQIQHRPSMLDLIDNRKLTTFPQVYNTVIGLSDQVEHESVPVCTSKLTSDNKASSSALFPTDSNTDNDVRIATSLMTANSLDSSIVFVEDYFSPDSAATLPSNTFNENYAFPTKDSPPRTFSSSSTTNMQSLSPFSTMRRGTFASRSCVHCSKPLYETSAQGDAVCADCAGFHQLFTDDTLQHPQHQKQPSPTENPSSAFRIPYNTMSAASQLFVKKRRTNTINATTNPVRRTESLMDLPHSDSTLNPPLTMNHANTSSASLLMMMMVRGNSEGSIGGGLRHRGDWYTTVRKKLRWRWRISGLLPQGLVPSNS